MTFADATALATTATISAPGAYVLRLTASDGEFSMSDDVQVTVVDPPEPSSLVMHSEPGDWIGDGQDYNFTALDGDFSAFRQDDNSVSITFGFHIWNLKFVAPGYAPLKPGIYDGARAPGFPDMPGLEVMGDGRAPSSIVGSFEIKKIIYGEDHAIVAFWATFEQRSDGKAARPPR